MNMTMMESFWFLIVFLLISLVSSCPSDCGCKWKGGKQWVECVSRNLRTFPPTIDPGTQVLDISGNSFETLPPDHFMRSGLINLQKIFLSKCRLSHINSRAFRGLSNLVELDLSENLLHEVPTSSFQDCQGLMRLVLNANSIPHIQRRAFSPLEALTSLELSRTGVEMIEVGAFEGLYSLEWLKLDGNRLRRLSGLNILPLTLKGISLEDNPWECDCHLVELRVWLSDRNVANSVDPRCNGPDRLANQTIKTLDQEYFACFPQLSPTTMYQKIGEGRNVSLLCKVMSIPESTLEWLFNGQPLSNSSLNLLVETTSAYPYPHSTNLLNSSSSSSLINPIEKKSELLILNATSEENGTFLCVARNPGGVAFANFTLRVLTKYDTHEGAILDYTMSGFGQIPNLVSTYPNLFIILLSTLAVMGMVIVVFSLVFVTCQCKKGCKRRHGRGRMGNGESDKICNGNGTSNNDVQSDCCGGGGGKLDRNLSNVSTLTNTKSSSVFLLSQEIGDSNPDLIEGTVSKRVDGDGLDASSIKTGSTSNSIHNFKSESSTMYYNVGTNTNTGTMIPQHLHHLLLQHPNPSRQPQVQNNPYSTLPHGFRNGGLVLKPIHWPIELEYGLPLPQGIENSIVPSSNYLSKYPKEYINPHEFVDFPYVDSNPNPNQCYTSFMDYNTALPYQSQQIPIPLNCSCGPILEGNETEESTTVGKNCKTKTASTSTMSPVGSDAKKLIGCSSSESLTQSTSPNSSKIVKSESKNKLLSASVRPKVQFNTVINESPDEGYEDGGTEI